MMRALPGFLALLCLGIACLADAAPPAVAVPPAGMRLGESVRPLSYDVQLTVVPNQERITGRVAITLEMTEATTLIWLNAAHLDFKRVTFTSGTRTVVARVVITARDIVGIRLPQLQPSGRAVLTIDYEANLERAETAGAFRAHEGDDWYAFTHLEPIAARRVFPCFDEPGWKTPWKLTLDVPQADTAASNAPAIGEDPLPGGMKRVRFAATPPLSSDLVSFAVGPFDVVDGGRAGRKPTAVRYLVPRGRGSEAGFGHSATPRILEALEDYVGAAYPFDKLDLVAVPVSSGLAVSQSPGLISVAADLLLAKPDEQGSDFQRTYVDQATRALTEQWFGDLVTPPWWDDAWLDQSVALWMAGKVSQRFDPEWLSRLGIDRQRQDAVAMDRLNSIHALHQAIDSPDDLGTAFDVIATEKGAAVLRMIETWVGEDHMRAALRHYLAGNPYGTARSEDFLSALEAEAGSEQGSLGAVFHAMIDRAGAPEMDVGLVCPTGAKTAPRLELNQRRYSPASRRGIPAPAPPSAAGTSWVFPTCFQYGEGGDFGEECIVVRDPHQVLQLPDGESCPDWVVANRDGTGYVVPVLGDPLSARLEHAPLLPDEAVAVIGDTRILAAAREIPLERTLAMAVRFAPNRQPPVAQAALSLLESVPPAMLGASSDRDAFARFIRIEFGPRAQVLGWLPKPGEREVDALLREELVPLVADRGADPALRAQADKLARDWLAGKVNLAGMLRPILLTAAHFGSSDLFEGYLAAADRSVGRDRRILYQGLGAFRDPKLLDEALSLALSDRIDARDAWTTFLQAAGDPVSTPVAMRFFADHYDALMQRLPESALPALAERGKRLCDPQSRRDFESFFGDPAHRGAAGARVVAQALEAQDLCLADRELQVQSLRSFLSAPAYRN